MIAKSHRWQRSAIAAAALALLGLSTTGAHALSLGRITVQSALGEPLRAEVDVPDINPDEAESLKASVASPEAFTAAGLDYNAALTGLQASLQKRADGRSYLRLTSSRSVSEPFIDLILEATWSSGRIVRDYTLLFDPPVARKTPNAPTLAQTAPAAETPAAPAAKPAPAQVVTPQLAVEQPARPAVTARPVAAAKPPATTPTTESGQVTVKSGDTASKIAGATKASGVSLDQMLVALLRANPDAFVNDNINRIRAGAVMSVPGADVAQSVTPAEATKIVIAQSKDFNDFRRNLATNAPTAAVAAADRKASGKVEAKIEDKKPAAATPDKLTLSKGSVQAKADEAKIAKEREAKDAAAREAELAKNKKDLESLKAAANALPAKPATSQAKPGVPVPVVAAPAASEPAKPAPAPAPAVAPVASAPAPVAAPAPAAVASAPPKPAKVAVPVPEPLEEPGLVDELLKDPLVPIAAAGGLLVLLGGFAAYRIRQRKKNAAQVDSAFLESRLQPDSFFGASGGQRVDTNNGPASASSMVYSASQLDAADDVDPVAEADVYLAYGRDLQAEEILKEAVRTNPGRLAIHTKLLEIFAKRRDAKGYESAATQAYKLTGSSSPEWSRICETGLSLDPTNPLYQPGGAPDGGPAYAPAAVGAASTFGSSTIPQSAHAELAPSAPGVDLDLDLDFSLDDEPASAISDVTGGTIPQFAPEPTVKMQAAPAAISTDLEFDLPIDEPVQTAPAAPDLPSISLDLDDHNDRPAMNFDSTSPMPVQVAAPAAPVADSGMLEFDLGSLSLDLDPPAESPTEAPSLTEDPLETKLALAEEFISIGDEDGARALIEEVMSEASGEMRAKAQRALANLR